MIKAKEAFSDYLIIGAILQIIASLIKVPIEYFVDILIIFEVESLVMAGFSFYFYIFHKDKLALKLIPILLGVSLSLNILEQFFMVDWTLRAFLRGFIMYLPAFFITSLLMYLVTLFIMWLYKKIKILFKK